MTAELAAGFTQGVGNQDPELTSGPGTQELLCVQKTWCWSGPTDYGNEWSLFHPVHKNAMANGDFKG